MSGRATPRFQVPVDDLIRDFRTDDRFAPFLRSAHEIPARPARYEDWPEALPPPLLEAARGLGIARPYTHQARALHAALAPGPGGLAVAAGTASGKSLCYTLPIAERALAAPGATALLLFPTKALARDQLAALEAWDRALRAQGREGGLRPAAYDGDTPRSARARARREARTLLTNPDMLHAGILPQHPSWADFLARLSWVVIDEMHVYRGVFGSHVANLMRRLRRVARFHGASPRFALTSATIANPGELAEKLSGGPVTVIDEDGAPRGRRFFLFYEPPLVDEELGIRRSSVLEAERIARHFLEGGVQTIVFARSRQATELLVRYIAERVPGGENAVRGYRGGYVPSERREIERALRAGELRGVVATNALELGIDIGDLDACVMAGYPGSVASTWQQAGRAGRRRGTAVATLVASAAPLDQYIVRHPEVVLGRPPEAARIDPDNLLILLDHVRCAAFELPFDASEEAEPFGGGDGGDGGGGGGGTDGGEGGDRAPELRGETRASTSAPERTPEPGQAQGGELGEELGEDGAEDAGSAPVGRPAPTLGELLAILQAQGLLRRARGRWYWLAEGYPAADVSLRGEEGEGITIVLGDPEGGAGRPGEDKPGHVDAVEHIAEYAAEGFAGGTAEQAAPTGRADVLGTVDRTRAPSVVHPGAVYLHEGRAYRVVALDWAAGRAWVRPDDGATYTRASTSVRVRPERIEARRAARGAELGMGELEVVSRATGYRELRFRTHETLGWGPIELPERRYLAGGYWFGLEEDVIARLRRAGHWRHDPLTDRGPSWPEQRDRARERDGYRCAVCDAPERPERQHDVHHIRPFRDFGWVPGRNETHRDANHLSNLVTLCPGCHRKAERALGAVGALSGVGYALQHIAPLFLMCDPADLGVSSEAYASWSRRPSVIVYERAAAGVGFGEALYQDHERVMAAALELVEACACAAGCPACVGPAAEAEPGAKARSLALLRELA